MYEYDLGYYLVAKANSIDLNFGLNYFAFLCLLYPL